MFKDEAIRGMVEKKEGRIGALKKMIKTVIKWVPVIYPIVRKIMKDRKASKQKNMSASRTAG
ncbi:hypothetical protein B4145_4281 [Bacillus subtilis]|uniref:YqzE family protein n=2 Tax=Bacillus subtilis TaxID=1423 RepID=A0ABD3ZVM7_BACIU|nr:hypothetical protein B4067_4368 [Bacillus subtilis subsp. subtilis]KIN58767.1 hypothetical protein B4145_4281 [Bacillus subtilis]